MSDVARPGKEGALRPCPFCGAEPRIIERAGAAGVKCTCSRTSFVQHYGKTRSEAIAAWNRRAALTADAQGDDWAEINGGGVVTVDQVNEMKRRHPKSSGSSPLASRAQAGVAANERLADAEARIMQEFRWGNLTKLGVANHLRRAGFKLHIACDMANALAPAPAPPVSDAAQDETLDCPVCALPIKHGDTCATDIELGTCHAECLEGSPTVDLETGDPVDGPIPTFIFEELGTKPGRILPDPSLRVSSPPSAVDGSDASTATSHPALAAQDGVREAANPYADAIYIASKTKHAERWKKIASVDPVSSTWIFEAGEGETSDFNDLWKRCIREASNSKALVAYHEEGEVMKGAWAEIGAAMACGVPVHAVGFEGYTIGKSGLIKHHATMKDAVTAALKEPRRATLRAQPAPAQTGWKLVPGEPTDEMMEAFAEAMSDERDRIRIRNVEAGRANPHGTAVVEWFATAYRAMLAASPRPEGD